MRHYSVKYKLEGREPNIFFCDANYDEECKKEFEKCIGKWDDLVIETLSLLFYMTNEDFYNNEFSVEGIKTTYIK